jgi:hypothetical protein
MSLDMSMSWIEKKFEEQRREEQERLKKEAEAEARRRLHEERILNLWGRLIHTIEQDILAFNQHPDAPGKLVVTILDNSFELHWQENYGPLLLLELNLDQQVLQYSTPVQQPEKWHAHIGEIKFSSDFELLIPNGASATKKASLQDASRFLLEPVLF